MKLKFIGKITDKNGEPILGEYSVTERKITCQFSEYQKVKSYIDGQVELMDQTSDKEELDRVRYRIGK